MIIVADAPSALGGVASAPNPQELLFAALNTCMTVGYVVAAVAEGVHWKYCKSEPRAI